jgi:hypothetical protein
LNAPTGVRAAPAITTSFIGFFPYDYCPTAPDQGSQFKCHLAIMLHCSIEIKAKTFKR